MAVEYGSNDRSSEILPAKVMDESCLKDNSDPVVYANIQELLAREVKNYPCLYNVYCKDYKNVRLKERCWQEIGSRLAMEAEVCRGKWRNVRDRYVKEMRKLRSGSASTTTKPWPLIPKLKFLDVSVNRKRIALEDAATMWDPSLIMTSEALTAATLTEEVKQACSSPVPLQLVVTSLSADYVGNVQAVENISQMITTNSEAICMIKSEYNEASNSGHSSSTRLVNISAETTDEEASTSADQLPSISQDADISFLLSMLPQLRKIPDRRKNLLKIEMLQLIDKAAEGVDHPEPIAAHTSHIRRIFDSNPNI